MLVQLLGALFILAAFTMAQAGRLDMRSPAYLAVNFAGSAILAYDAWHGHDVGFLVLEVAWALVSGWGLLQLLRGRAPAPAH